MGASSFSILSEIYLQFIQHNEILKILTDQKIISYSRYVDVYNHTLTNIEQVIEAFNNIYNNIQFTLEK
jgi:hypothetical protein